QLLVWDLGPGAGRSPIRVPGVGGVFQLSPDGKRLAVSGQDGSLELWDLGRGELAALLQKPGITVRALDLARDGRTLAALGQAGRSAGLLAAVWDGTTGDLRFRVPGAAALALTPDGKVLATWDQMQGQVKLWDAATGKQTDTLGSFGMPNYGAGLHFS